MRVGVCVCVVVFVLCFWLRVRAQRCSLFHFWVQRKDVALADSDSHLGTQEELDFKCNQDKAGRKEEGVKKVGREGKTVGERERSEWY